MNLEYGPLNPFMPTGTYMYCQRAKNSNFSDFDDILQSFTGINGSMLNTPNDPSKDMTFAAMVNIADNAC